LFVTCLVDQLFPRVGEAMAATLRRLGCEVTFNEAQTCCGQPAFNTGYRAEARALAEHFLRVFERARGVTSVVKSKSMATEEIELNHALEAAGIRPIETDLGEYIIQLAREKPSHIIVPAIHKTREQIAELFAEKLKCGLAREVAEITAVARERL